MSKNTGKREAKRIARLYKDRQLIANLRKYFTGYDAKDGISLSVDKIAKLPYSKRRGIRRKAEKLQELISKPFVDFVKPADDISRKALKDFTGQRMRGQKYFIVAKPSEDSSVRVVEGTVQVRTEFPGEVAHTERFFMFPRSPRGPGDLLKMFDKLFKKMPPGDYDILTRKYDAIMYPVDRGQLRDEVLRLLETYDNPKYGEDRFLHVLTGFRYTAMSTKSGMMQAEKRHDARARQREWNRQQREKVQQEIKDKTRCAKIFNGRRCKKQAGHKGPHKY